MAVTDVIDYQGAKHYRNDQFADFALLVNAALFQTEIEIKKAYVSHPLRSVSLSSAFFLTTANDYQCGHFKCKFTNN